MSGKATPESSTYERSHGSLIGYLGIWFVLGFVSLCLFLILGWSLFSGIRAAFWVPVNLHSILEADYSADFRTGRIQPVNLQVIGEALQDAHPGQNDTQNLSIPERYATLEMALKTPVPTVTPFPGQASSTPSVTPTATQSLSTPTTTRTQTATPSRTATITASPSPTTRYFYPTASPQPTNTRRPRQTNNPGATSPPPTRTPAHPTATRVPPTQPPPTRPPDPYPPPTSNPYP
jgi:hypothetical protein